MPEIRKRTYVNKIGIQSKLITTQSGNNIYLLNDGNKFKQFSKYYHSLLNKENNSFYHNLLSQTEEKSEIISFARIVIATKRILYGIISNYEEGVNLSELFKDELSISQLIEMIIKIEEEIDLQSQHGWLFEDLHEENILVSKKPFCLIPKIIDTDFYEKKSECDFEYLRTFNYKRLFSAVINTLLPRINMTNNAEIKRLYYLGCAGKIKCSDFLIVLLSIYKKNITNTNELRLLLK